MIKNLPSDIFSVIHRELGDVGITMLSHTSKDMLWLRKIAGRQICEEVAKEGDSNLLVGLIRSDYPYDVRIGSVALINGHIDTIYYLIGNGIVISLSTLSAMTSCGKAKLGKIFEDCKKTSQNSNSYNRFVKRVIRKDPGLLLGVSQYLTDNKRHTLFESLHKNKETLELMDYAITCNNLHIVKKHRDHVLPFHLEMSIINCKPKIVKYLLTLPHTITGITLMYVVGSDDIEILKLFTNYSSYLFDIAFRGGHVKVIEWLANNFKLPCDDNLLNSHPDTLRWWIDNDHPITIPVMFKLILKHDHDIISLLVDRIVENKQEFHHLILGTLAAVGHFYGVKTLIDNGYVANHDIVLDAVSSNNIEIVKYLIDKGYSRTITCKFGPSSEMVDVLKN